MITRVLVKSYGEYIRQNTLRNKRERLKHLKIYLDMVYKNKDKIEKTRYNNKFR